ncbi:MAG: type II secretion system F family protein [Burkholderiaceae bacterium]|nr:type II secretion system F family protein [Microbacteriaceae bacterium]
MLGIGLWSLVSLVPRLNRPRLLFRVAPYVVDISPGARALLATRTVNPLPVVGTILGPLADRARAALSSLLGGVLGGAESVRLRLRQSGSALTVEGFRSRQLAWALVGAAVGTVVAFAATRAQAVPLIAQLAIVLLCGVAGVLLCDRVLQHRSRTRLDRMTAELPTVLEFLTLSLSAGEGIPDAIRRVVRVSSGELAVELAVMIAAVGTGLPFTESLRTLSDDLRLPPFSRAVEQIVGAIDRGTPLAEVLRAQAQDARDDAKRRLIETAGKKEVAMLVPLVFLILPTTIVFAIFPGIFVLQLGF